MSRQRHTRLFLDVIFPLLRKAIDRGYFSLEVKGLEHVPQKGAIVYAANHSGWFTLDAFFFALIIHDRLGVDRMPYGVAHDLLLKTPGLRAIFGNLDSVPASWLRKPDLIPREIESVGIFPEGEAGNCKPFWKAYQMQPWKSGFVRFALLRNAKVIPVAIMGGEESLPVAWASRAMEPLIGVPIPIPLFPVPLPSRWKFIFHPPIDLSSHGRALANDHKFCRATAADIQSIVQNTLDVETKDRPIKKFRSLLKRYVVRKGRADAL